MAAAGRSQDTGRNWVPQPEVTVATQVYSDYAKCVFLHTKCTIEEFSHDVVRLSERNWTFLHKVYSFRAGHSTVSAVSYWHQPQVEQYSGESAVAA